MQNTKYIISLIENSSYKNKAPLYLFSHALYFIKNVIEIINNASIQKLNEIEKRTYLEGIANILVKEYIFNKNEDFKVINNFEPIYSEFKNVINDLVSICNQAGIGIKPVTSENVYKTILEVETKFTSFLNQTL